MYARERCVWSAEAGRQHAGLADSARMGVRDYEGPGERAASNWRAAVLVPVLNEARHLERALATMREQELDGGLEILVIDGGSTDGSRAIVAKAARTDHRIRRLDNPAGRTP